MINVKMDIPLVSIICLCYNHERYLRKCLDSIVSQSCDFKYEIIVHDDASTDSSQSILREYDQKYDNLRVIYQKENQYSKKVRIIPKLIDLARGEYIAFCECDDYFSDKNKIQKQIIALLNNKDCIACIHSAYRVNEKDNKILGYRNPYIMKKILNKRDIIQCIGRLYSLNSLVCKKDSITDLDDLYYNCTVGDIPIALHLSLKGNFYFINKPMSSYRVGSVNSWSVRMRYNRKAIEKYTNSVIKTLQKFDLLTNMEYSDCVNERILCFKFQKAIAIGDLKLFLSESTSNYRKEMNLRSYVYSLIMCCVNKIRSYCN